MFSETSWQDFTFVESFEFLVCKFRTLLIDWYFHFGVCIRIRAIFCEIPLIIPSQHHPKRSSTALRLRSVLTHRRWFVPDKAAPRQTSLFGVLTSLSCRRFVKVRVGACFAFVEGNGMGFGIFWKYLKLLFLYWNVGFFWKFLSRFPMTFKLLL